MTTESIHTIHIYGRHTSYNVQKVLWLADELDLVYTHTETGGRFGGNDTAKFREMNPVGKVPVLKIGNRTVWESNTILRFLADSYSDGEWLSLEPYLRSQSDRWLDWSIDRLEVAFVGVFWGFYRTPPEKRNHISIQKSVSDCELCLDVLADQLGDNNFLIGENPTVADVSTGVFLHRIKAIDLEIRIPPKIDHWYIRLSERPGYRRWVMSDFSELEGRSDY